MAQGVLPFKYEAEKNRSGMTALAGVSGARGFHPRALPEPYVSLSTHTAPITQPPTETLPSARRDQVVAKRFPEST